jgi:2-(1,2-epoxy-1,2-dihydrophenyl)acetyl-CoA isomerase
MSSTILVEKKDGVATVAMNRPERMNSLTNELLTALAERLREVADDPDVRVVVLTGSGDRAFSAGADLAPPDAPSPADRHASGRQTLEESFDGLKRVQESSWILHTMPKPTLAAINGAVAGASLSMSMACDLRVAVEGAVFTTAFQRIGFSGDFGGSYFATKLLGSAKARELYLLGERFDAAEALRIGLISRVVPHDQLRDAALAAAREVLQTAPDARSHVKRMLNERYGNIDYHTMFWALAHAQEPREGMQAFMEKRPPSWVPEDLT